MGDAAITFFENIRVRTDLRPGDLGHILTQHGLLYAQECDYDHTFEGYVAETMMHFAHSFDPVRERVWIVEANETMVGSIGIVGQSAVQARLRWFLLDPSVRGIGLGKWLMTQALDFARMHGYTSVLLSTVGELTPAVRLYESAGFALVSEQKIKMWGQEITEQFYELRW